MNLLFSSDIANLLFKTNVEREREDLVLLFWSALIVGGRMVRLGRWQKQEDGEAWFLSKKLIQIPQLSRTFFHFSRTFCIKVPGLLQDL